jgi:phage/plasmid-associated DNA primase
LHEYSPATRRRLKLINWAVDFKGREDNDLKDTLPLESTGILNWMLEGARLYYAGELKHVPEAVQEATAEFWAGMNTVGQWLIEKCVLEEGARTDSTNLCADYARWSTINQIPVITKKPFLSNLRLQDIKTVKTSESGGKTWVHGIRLKNSAEMEMPYQEDEQQSIPHKPVASETNAHSGSTATDLPVKHSKFERVN